MMKLRTKIEAVFVSMLMLGVVIVSIGYASTTLNNNGMTEDATGISWTMKEADWIVYTDGASYYGVNGTNGKITFQNNTYLGGADNVIQSCINALPNTIGGHIVLKPGYFYVDNTIQLYRNSSTWTPMWIQGSGIAVTRLYLVTGSNCNVINWTVSGTRSDGFKRLSDFQIDGNKAGQTTGGQGIHIDTSGTGGQYDFCGHDLFIIRCFDDGINHEDGWGARWSNIITEDNGGIGILLRGNQLYMDNIFAAYNGETGIYTRGTEICATNLDSRNNEQYGIYIYGSASMFTNLIVDLWGHDSFDAYGGLFFGSVSHNNTVSNVVLIGNGSRYTYKGIWMYGKNNTVSNVDVYGTYSYAVSFNSAAEDNVVRGICKGTGGECDNGGKRNIYNGISVNAGVPGSAGNWASYTKAAGVMVWNTAASGLYIRVNATWKAISVT